MKLLALFSRFDIAKLTAKAQFDAITYLTADEGLLGTIAHHLRYKPATWVRVYDEFMIQDIKEVYPMLPPDADVVMCTTFRWTLVRANGVVLPFVFVTKGGSTRLFRIVIGPNANWLLTLHDEVSFLIQSKAYAGGEDKPKAVELDTSTLPKLHRDPKWEAGGVKW